MIATKNSKAFRVADTTQSRYRFLPIICFQFSSISLSPNRNKRNGWSMIVRSVEYLKLNWDILPETILSAGDGGEVKTLSCENKDCKNASKKNWTFPSTKCRDLSDESDLEFTTILKVSVNS